MMSHPTSTKDDTDDEEDNACPICLCNPSAELEFLEGPCHHAACRPCMERLLLTHSSSHAYSNDDFIPTRSKCPICRTELSLFELVVVGGGNVMAYEKDSDIKSSPIFGKKYAPRLAPHQGLPGLRLFSFEEDTPTIEVSIPFPLTVPYKTFHFHAKSNTFHGTLNTNTKKWKVILQFSSDFRYISNGMIEVIECDDSKNEERAALDGDWIVSWAASGMRDRIHVSQSAFSYLGYHYSLNLENPNQPTFTWPVGEPRIVQTAVTSESTALPTTSPQTIGSRIVWETSENERIIWTRQTIGNDQIHRLGPGRILYCRVDTDDSTTSRQRPTYHGDTLWGNVFCQAYRVGFASYHFIIDDNDTKTAYISYQHALVARWPPLDNGTPVPSKVYFHNVEWNEDEYTFSGTIEWLQDYETTWQGCSKWIYEMKFDSEFTCIVSGSVKSVLLHHGEAQEMSSYGSDLVYINAAIQEKFDSRMNELRERDEQEGNVTSDYDRYVRVSRSIRSAVHREGASVRTVAAVGHILTELQRSDAEPIDFNL